MIRFLLVLLAFVSALLAFIFQETLLFVASGFLLLVAVVLLTLQVRETSRRKNRLKLPTDLSPDDELKARGILDVRPKSAIGAAASDLATEDIEQAGTEYAPAPVRESVASQEDLFDHQATIRDEQIADAVSVQTDVEETDRRQAAAETIEPATPSVHTVESDEREQLGIIGKPRPKPDSSKPEEPEDAPLETPVVLGPSSPIEAAEAYEAALSEHELPSEPEPAPESDADEHEQPEPVAERILRRRVDVDAHLPALHRSLGAHTVCLIDVDTDRNLYHLRSIVSDGAVADAGTEYPFDGFFLSDLLAKTTVLDIGGDEGLDIESAGLIQSHNGLRQLVAAPVICGELPEAFFVAAFETDVDATGRDAVTTAADFFGKLYALQRDATGSESPLASAKRNPEPLRLVKSNPRSAQRKIIEEEITRARGKARPLALALVCLDSGDELARVDETTVHQIEAWMRDCLESVTPDGRVEYFGELGYGILQTRDVTDIEGWIRRAQAALSRLNGPLRAQPVVGVAMLSEGHRGPDDLQADAFKALRAAYECGDSTILVG